MSERERHENPGKAHAPDHSKAYMAPRRFVFNVPDIQNEEKSSKSNRNFQIFQIPLLHEFPHPLNQREAYDGLCRYILETYTDIANLITTVCLEEVQDIVKTMKVQKPMDCIKFLRDIAVRFCTKMKENRQKKNFNNGDEYEKLLQQSETKIRELIRNEQIYRLNFEQLTTKSEEAEKLLIEAQIKLEDNKNTIENLTKETARITAAFHAKDEELRSMHLERKAYLQQQHQQNFGSNAATTTANTDSPQVVENLRTKTQSWNSQNLKMLLSDNRLTPTEFSKLIPNLESSRVLQSIKSTNRTPTSTKTKTLQRSGTTLDVTSMNLKNLKLSGMEKMKDAKELVKSQVGTVPTTDRRKAEVLRSGGLNHSGRGLEYGFISHSRGASCQTISLIQDQNKSKSTTRMKARKESGRIDDKSLSPTKIKHHDEPATTLLKTDSFDDHGKSKSLIVVDHKDDLEGPIHLKVDQAHQATNYRRRSGVARTRPLISEATNNTQSQKSMEQRSLMSHTAKHPSSSTILSHRSVSKGKHTIVDNHGKPIKNVNSPFVNIMLKRFTDQEINATKKI